MNSCWVSSFSDIPRMKCKRFFSKCRSRHEKVPRMGRKERERERNMRRLVNESNLRIHRTPTHQCAMHNDANNINCCNESVTKSTEMIYVNCFWYTFIHDRCTLISFYFISLSPSLNSISIKNSSRDWTESRMKRKNDGEKFRGTIWFVRNYKEVKNLKNYH